MSAFEDSAQRGAPMFVDVKFEIVLLDDSSQGGELLLCPVNE
jgi:hypothetical protein